MNASTHGYYNAANQSFCFSFYDVRVETILTLRFRNTPTAANVSYDYNNYFIDLLKNLIATRPETKKKHAPHGGRPNLTEKRY